MTKIALCVPADILHTKTAITCRTNDFIERHDGASRMAVNEMLQRAVVMEREENNPNWKQLCSYIVFQSQDCKQLLHYERGASAGEQRLSVYTSIGVGGHIESPDIMSEVLREVNEEIRFEGGIWSPKFEYMGLVYDGTTEVGQVHLGVVFLVQYPPYVKFTAMKETNNLRAETPNTATIKYEKWSRSIVESDIGQ